MRCSFRHYIRHTILLVAMLFAVLATPATPYQYYFKKIDARFDAIAERLNRLDFENRRADTDPKDLQQLVEIAGKRPQLQARALYWQVRMTQLNARPTECIKTLRRAERLCQPGYDYDLALIRYQLAGNYDRMSEYMQCYRNASAAIAIFKKEKDYYFLGNAQLLLAQLFHEINDDEHAIEQLALAKKSYEQAGYPLNRIYFYQGLLAKSRAEKASLLAKSAATGGRDWAMTVQAYVYLCDLALDKGQTQRAVDYYNMGKKELQKWEPKNVFFRFSAVTHQSKDTLRAKEIQRSPCRHRWTESSRAHHQGGTVHAGCLSLLLALLCTARAKGQSIRHAAPFPKRI